LRHGRKCCVVCQTVARASFEESSSVNRRLGRLRLEKKSKISVNGVTRVQRIRYRVSYRVLAMWKIAINISKLVNDDTRCSVEMHSSLLDPDDSWRQILILKCVYVPAYYALAAGNAYPCTCEYLVNYCPFIRSWAPSCLPVYSGKYFSSSCVRH